VWIFCCTFICPYILLWFVNQCHHNMRCYVKQSLHYSHVCLFWIWKVKNCLLNCLRAIASMKETSLVCLLILTLVVVLNCCTVGADPCLWQYTYQTIRTVICQNTSLAYCTYMFYSAMMLSGCHISHQEVVSSTVGRRPSVHDALVDVLWSFVIVAVY